MKNLEMRYFFVALLSGLALAALPQAGRAQGYDGLTVGGVEVTANNASNITGQNIQGTVSYDADRNTLTLNQAVIMNSTGIVAPGNLTVAVIGEGNVVNGSITSTGGNGTLTFKNGDDNSASLQYLPSFSGGATGFTNVVYDGIYLTAGNSRDLKYSPTRQRYEINENSSSSEVKLSSEKTYELWVGDIKVTEANRNNILSAVTATASFNPETSTLTLNGVSLTNTSISDAGIISRLDELTISVSGSNTITIVDSCTAIRADREGAQTLTIVKGGDDCSLSINGGRAIRDFSSLVVTGLYWDGIYTYDGMLLNHGVEVGYSTLTDVVAYDLFVAGQRVTENNASDLLGDNFDGIATFDAATHVLTLKDVSIPAGIESYLDELTIKVSGVNEINSESDGAIVYRGDEEGTLTIVSDDQAQGVCSLKLLNYNLEYSVVSGFSSFDYDGFYTHSAYSSLSYTDDSRFLYDPTTQGLVTEVLFSTAETYYSLWIAGTQVHNLNKDNVFNDKGKTVAYDDATHTLTLRNANIIYDYETIVCCSLDNLTVELIGKNYIHGYPQYPAFEKRGESQTDGQLVFTTSDDDPGQLVWYDVTGLAVGYAIELQNDLQQFDNSIATNDDDLGIFIGELQITSAIADDVFGDGTVSYNEDTQILTLNNAELSSDVTVSSDGGPTNLTVLLKGNSSISGQFITHYEGESPELTFTTNPNSPGSIELLYHTDQDFYVGFSTVSYENGLRIETDGSGITSISTFVLIDPIVDEDEPDNTVTIDNSEGDYDNLDGVVINDVYYTLSPDEGSFDGDAIAISYGMTDEEVENVVSSNKPSDAGFEAFRGITLMVPAGIGSVTVRAKSDNGGILKVKVGNAPAIAAPLPDEYDNIVINYECAEPTYIYLYASDPTAARGVGIHRGKVLTGVVKVKGYSASSAAVCSVGGANTATVYSLSCLGYTAGDTSVSMSEVSVPASSSSSVVSAARGPRKTDGSTITYKVTALGDNVFDLIENKDIIRYIDLSGTEIKGLTVNRTVGVFNGFGKNTLIYLPDGNYDGKELNVIVGNTCQEFTLSDNRPFRAPSGTFTAAKIQLEREFTVSQTSTLMLPFTIPAAKADDMGTFHSFKEIKDGNAVFEKVNGDILANVPYIFVPKVKVLRVEDFSVTVSGSDAVEANQGELWGTYERIDWDGSQTNIYGFAATAEGDDIAAGEFVRLASGAWTLPFRAYIKTTTTEPSRLRLVIDDEQQTGIAVVGGQEVASGSWFTLDGRRLDGRPTQQGLYINNGVKVIVK